MRRGGGRERGVYEVYERLRMERESGGTVRRMEVYRGSKKVGKLERGKAEVQVTWNGAGKPPTSSTATIISATQGDGSKEK
jgi:hypothetical protein